MFCLFITSPTFANSSANTNNSYQKFDKKLAYIVSDINIPFWEIMSRGIKTKAESLGYQVDIYSANNTNKTEIANLIKAMRSKVDGIILSPTSSSASVTLLKLAQQQKVPVVISDIGTESGEHVSFISSNNENGAYKLGKILGKTMQDNKQQSQRVGIIAIPQKRANGKARTKGFLSALEEFGIDKAAIKQQVNFSYQETFDYTLELINEHEDLGALWLQGSNRYQAALDAIEQAGKKGKIPLICFDAEPEFIDLIKQGILVGSAMQQPFLMGEHAVSTLHKHLNGQAVEQNIQLDIMAISKQNIDDNLPLIKRNVLGIQE